MPPRELTTLYGQPGASLVGTGEAAPQQAKGIAAAYSPWQEAASNYDVHNMTPAEMREMAKLLFVRGAIDGTTYALMRTERRRGFDSGKPPVETGQRYDYVDLYSKLIEVQTRLGLTRGIENEIHVLAVLDRVAAQRQGRLDIRA